MTRYHFTIIDQGRTFGAYVDAKNQMTAHNRAKRMFPQAEHIHLVKSERIKDY